MSVPVTKLTTLFSLDVVRSYLRIKTTERDDDVCRLANAVSEFVERRTGRQFVNRATAEVRDGDGGRLLYLRRWPVVSLTSLSIKRSVTGTPETISLIDTTLDKTRGAVLLHNDVFTCGFANVNLEYVNGYGAQDSGDLPQDIVQTALDIAKLTWMEVDSNALASSTMQFGSTQLIIRPDWPKHIKATLDAWAVPQPIC